MATSFEAPASRPSRGGGAPRGARGGFNAGANRGRGGGIRSSNTASAPVELNEAEDVRQLRKSYSVQLATTRELFPEWSDEDILNALQDANGDVELTILRISEGHAQQWGAVKPKKTKKETSVVSSHDAPAAAAPASAPVISLPARGAFGDRGGRGGMRGGFENGRGMPRGGRGVARGGRGGFVAPAPAAPRVPYTNGDSEPTPSSYVSPAAPISAPVAAVNNAPALTVPTWGSSAPKWAAVAAAAPVVVSPPAASAKEVVETASSEWEAATEHSTTATLGWGDEAATESSTNGNDLERPQTPIAVSPPAVEATSSGWGAETSAAAADSATPSWSGEASLPKLRHTSKIIAPGSKMSWAQIARPASPPKPKPAPLPTVVIAPTPPAVVVVEPTPIAEVAQPISPPAVEEQAISAPSPNSTWNEAPAPGPLDAWASSPAAVVNGGGAGWADAAVAPDYRQQATAQVDVNAAAPIEVASPSPAAELAAEETFGSGPPGLSKRSSSGRQDTIANDRSQAVGVQFGSLSMYDGQNAQQADQQQSYAQEAPIQQYVQDPQQQYLQQQHEQQLHQQQQQQQLQQQQQQEQSSSFGQQAQPNPFPQQASAFSNRYGPSASSPYGIDDNQSSAPSPYAPFKNDAVSSPYFQQAQQSPIPQSAPAQATQAAPSSYAPFSAAPAPAQPDYSALYGQDALRNMGFYDQYGQQAAPSNSYQNPSALARSDDPSKPSTSTTPQPQSQPQQQQQHPGQQQQQGYPAMMPYYGYGYYPGYSQGYQQAPQAYGQQYGGMPQQQQSPYGMQQQQQYPSRNAQQGQYPQYQQQQQQPQGSLGGFRQGQAGQQQQYGYGYDQQQQQQQQQQQRLPVQGGAQGGVGQQPGQQQIAGQQQQQDARKDFSSKDFDLLRF